MPTNATPPSTKTRVLGACIAVAFLALLGFRVAKFMHDREQVQMYQQHQANYLATGAAQDIMEMQREQQLAEFQSTLDLFAGEANAESVDTEDAGFEPKLEITDPIRNVEDDEGPTPVYPDEHN